MYVIQPMHVYCVSVKHEELLVRIESYEIVIVQSEDNGRTLG